MAFAEVARQRSFARAAAALGIAPPTLSNALRTLEDKLGVRLLNRTTRSVALTEAGNELLGRLDPVLSGLDAALDELTSLRGSPTGRLRLLVVRTAAMLTVGPLVPDFLAAYPGIELEMLVEDTNIDLVRHHIDAGIQIGERIDKDMIALRLVEPFEMRLVATPSYLQRYPPPLDPTQLSAHDCVRLRSAWDGTIHPWVLQRGGDRTEIPTHGPLIVNDLRVMANAVAGGVGIGLLPDVLAGPLLESGALVSVLSEWISPVSGLYIYHPSRRHTPAPLGAFIDFIRSRKLPQ
jgi:DNA-binding transcriptional LysR family regulator